MSGAPFPTGRWGRVVRAPRGEKAQRVRIDDANGGGFVIVTDEPHGVFDCWVERAEDVAEYLETLEIDWAEA